MAAGENNPIKYSDLIKEDGAILKAKDQIEELMASYRRLMTEVQNDSRQLVTSITSVSGATQQGQTVIRSAAGETDRLTRAQRALEQAYDDQAEELARLRLLTNEQNTLNRTTARLNNATEGSYNRLSAQYSLNRIRLNQMTAAERDNTQAGRELTEQTRLLREEMDRLQRATGNFSLNVGNYPDQLTNLIGLNGQFGESLRGLLQNGGDVRGMFTEMGTQALAFGRTLLVLLSNPVFLAIAGIAAAGAAFKWWYDYNVGLIQATKLTKQFTGESGNDLKALRNEVQATADMYGKDFKEVLIASNALAKQFGISQQEAIKLVQDGFISGADANGEFLETIKEYPAYFKEAGLSASQFIAITTQSAKSGIYSDKAIDTIKEGNIRIREMTKSTAMALEGIGLNYKELQVNLQNGSITTFDVLQMVSEKLGELPESSAVVGTAIADIFGGPGEDAGLAYLKTLKDIDTDLSNVTAKSGELGESARELLDSNAELANVTSALFDQTGGTFEMLINYSKILANDGLVAIVKGMINVVNWGIKIYNTSIAWRASIVAVTLALRGVWETAKIVFTYMADQAKAVGDALVAISTLDFKGFDNAMRDMMRNQLKAVKDISKSQTKIMNDAIDNVNKKIKPIEIPVLTVGEVTGPTKGGGRKAPIANYDKPAKKVKDTTEKDLAEAYKKNLELRRRYEDAVLELETNAFDQRRQKAIYNYDRQIEDLKHQLATDKKLTAENITSIMGIISTAELQKTAELKKIENERQVSLLELQKGGIQLRLDASKKESEEEYKLRLQLLELERQIELAQNKNKAPSEQQSEVTINAKYDSGKSGIDDEFRQRSLARFDFTQQLEQSEFDMLRSSEFKKTQFRLQQEKARLQKILELNKTMGNQLSAEQVKTYENMIKKIDQDLESGEGKDIYDLMGLNLDDDAKEAISESVSFAMEQIQTVLDKKVEAADKAVEAADKEVDSAEKALDFEKQARANGYANNVLMAQKELDQAKKNQEKAIKEREKAVKQQQLLDTISQTSSLITAAAGIWSSLSSIPVVGTALALAAIGVMFGSFAFSKIKARSTTKGDAETFGDGGMIETISGGSHQSGNDVDFGVNSKGRRRKVEGGETVAIFNKRNTRKYRSVLPNVVRSINNGSFADKYLSAYDGAKNISIDASSESLEVGQIRDDVREMKDRRRYIVDGNGNTVEFYKNLKRTIKR